jgi:hypothetical protein
MDLTADQERVFASIITLSAGNRTVPVTIGAIHGTFSAMDVRDLVVHLQVLLRCKLIENAKPAHEGISNSFLVTPGGWDYYHRESTQPR